MKVVLCPFSHFNGRFRCKPLEFHAGIFMLILCWIWLWLKSQLLQWYFHVLFSVCPLSHTEVCSSVYFQNVYVWMTFPSHFLNDVPLIQQWWCIETLQIEGEASDQRQIRSWCLWGIAGVLCPLSYTGQRVTFWTDETSQLRKGGSGLCRTLRCTMSCGNLQLLNIRKILLNFGQIVLYH